MTSSISSAVRQLMLTANQNQPNGNATSNGGGFLEIITQSLETMANTNTSENGQVCDMLGALLEKLKKQSSPEAMAALMELFAQNPALGENFLAQFGEELQMTIGSALNGDKSSLNSFLESFKNEGTLSKADTQKVVSFLENLPTNVKQSINQKLNANDQFKQLFNKLGGEVVKAEGSIEKTESTEEHLSVLQTAKEQKQTKTDNNIDKNVDESEVKTFNIKDILTVDTKGNVEVSKADKVENPQNDKFEIINQFKEGFLENISKKRFTVRLKPEGLGEITVNMMNNDGKLTLSILASNQTVQKALEGNLANLQSSLRQHNAEIITINETSHKQNSSLDLGYGREQNQNHQHQQNQNKGQKYPYDYKGNLSDEAQDMMDLKEYLLATNSLIRRV